MGGQYGFEVDGVFFNNAATSCTRCNDSRMHDLGDGSNRG